MVGGRCVAAFLLGLGVAAGCSTSRAVRTELGMARPGEAVGAVGGLMSARDREQLATIAAERAEASAEDGYRIGPDDLLDIRIPDLLEAGGAQGQGQSARAQSGATLPSVAESPVFQLGARVSASGQVNIPLLGLIRAEGFTPTALEQDIARRLMAARILKAPQVNVLVTEYRSRVVAVVGSVEKPGLYPLTRPRATLADLIWAAGGPGKDAGREVKFVPAADGAHPDGMARSEPIRSIRVDLETLLDATGPETKALNPEVRPGDSISLSPAGNVQVDGWVDKPGSYPVTRGLTLTGAVAAAGGHLFPADRRHVTVKRVLGAGEQRYFTVDLDAVSQGRAADFPITDGDVVRLPPTPTRVAAWGFWAFAKEVVHIYGSVPVF